MNNAKQEIQDRCKEILKYMIESGMKDFEEQYFYPDMLEDHNVTFTLTIREKDE